jgi:hypothetical protein
VHIVAVLVAFSVLKATVYKVAEVVAGLSKYDIEETLYKLELVAFKAPKPHDAFPKFVPDTVPLNIVISMPNVLVAGLL